MQKVIIIFGALAAASPAVAQDAPGTHDTANWAMIGCREANSGSTKEIYRQGFCMGAVRALVIADPKICPPAHATGNQSVRIVVQYIDGIPARQHENFAKLAVEGLQKAWPCR